LTWAGAGVVAAAVDFGGLVSPVLSQPAFAVAKDDPGRGLFGGLTTIDQTVIRPDNVKVHGGYTKLQAGAGEPYLVRSELAPRTTTFGNGDMVHANSYRRPLVGLMAFAQITDLHIIDDQSPGRVEFTDRLADGGTGFPTDSAYRPHEMLTTQIVDAAVRSVRNIGTGPITGLTLDRTLVTGDMVDNLQLNETRWYIDLLDGGHTITPDSGQIGLEESVSYLFSPDHTHDAHYWNPEFQTTDNYKSAGYASIPGLLAAARRPFTSTGLGMRWYAAMGNHDGEIQGNLPVHPSGVVSCFVDDISGMATDNKKAYFSTALHAFPRSPGPDDIKALVGGLLFAPVTADSKRRMLSAEEFSAQHNTTTGLPVGHGLADPVNGSMQQWYSIPYGNGDLIRFIALDTVNYDGNAGGRIHKDQFNWLEDQLKGNSSRYLNFSDGDAWVTQNVQDKLYVLFFHHTIDSIDNTTGDLVEGDPGVHTGDGNYRYEQDVVDLLSRFPNVVLVVNGHTHTNRIKPHFSSGFQFTPPGNEHWGYWEVSTASHVDWPVQSRIFEFALGGDVASAQQGHGNGILSIFTGVVDIDAPLDYAGDLSTPKALASLGRELAANDPTERGSSRRGAAWDRNAQLLVTMPFNPNKVPVVLLPDVWGSSVALGRNPDGHLELFECDGDNQIAHRWESPAGSDSWNALQNFDTTSERLRAVATEVHHDGRLALFGVNGTGDVYYRPQILAGGWSPYVLLGRINGRAIAAAKGADGRIEVFVATAGGSVARTFQTVPDAESWAPWNSGFGLFDGAHDSGEKMVDVAAHANKDGRAELFAVSRNGLLFHRWQLSAGGWSDWAEMTLPAFATGDTRPNTSFATTWARFNKVAVVDSNDGRLVLFAVDHNRQVWWRVQKTANVTADSDWSSWTAMSGRMTQITACRMTNGAAAGTVRLLGVDHQGAIWSRRQTAPDATTWTEWAFFQSLTLPTNESTRFDVPVTPDFLTAPRALVPDLVGMKLADGRQALLDGNLQWTVPGAGGTLNSRVTGQSPAAGTSALQGAAVQVTVGAVKADVACPSIAVRSSSDWRIAFQAANGQLWTRSSDGSGGPVGGQPGRMLMPGSSPVIVALPSGGYQIVYQAISGNLSSVSAAGAVTDLGLAMAPGTSPSIAVSFTGAWRIAFQAKTGQLWTLSSDGSSGPVGGQPGHMMMPGTSPSIVTLLAGGYLIAYQGSDGMLTFVSAAGAVTGLGLGMAPGTSPSLAAQISGDWRIAFQANNTLLWTRSSDGTGGPVGSQPVHTMMPGTSPSIVASQSSGYQIVYQTSDGVMGGVSPSGQVTGLGLGMWKKSSVSAVLASGGFQAVFESSDGKLWTLYPDLSAQDLKLGMPMDA
jgi:metallophosphoesterase (TIGR03767 family)